MLPQPRPEHLNWIEVRRAGRDLEKLDILLLVIRVAGFGRQELLVVTQQMPRAVALGGLQLPDGLQQTSFIQCLCPLVCAQLLRLVVDNVAVTSCRDGSPQREGPR